MACRFAGSLDVFVFLFWEEFSGFCFSEGGSPLMIRGFFFFPRSILCVGKCYMVCDVEVMRVKLCKVIGGRLVWKFLWIFFIFFFVIAYHKESKIELSWISFNVHSLYYVLNIFWKIYLLFKFYFIWDFLFAYLLAVMEKRFL